MSITTFEIGGTVLDVESVPVGAARSDMPTLMRKSHETGRGYLIRNAKNPAAATALLIDTSALEKRMSQARPVRTLGKLLEGLPFRHLGLNPIVDLTPLPNDVLPVVEIPGGDAIPDHSRRISRKS